METNATHRHDSCPLTCYSVPPWAFFMSFISSPQFLYFYHWFSEATPLAVSFPFSIFSLSLCLYSPVFINSITKTLIDLFHLISSSISLYLNLSTCILSNESCKRKIWGCLYDRIDHLSYFSRLLFQILSFFIKNLSQEARQHQQFKFLYYPKYAIIWSILFTLAIVSKEVCGWVGECLQGCIWLSIFM